MTMTAPHRKNVKDLNDFLTCKLCNGYLIDATTLIECHHVFCRGCILRHFESNSKTVCPYPHCNTAYKAKKTQAFFKPDQQLQALIYKLVPGLYSKEMQRRDDFYRSTGGARASSSCSDDSVIERERGLHADDAPEPALAPAGRAHFFGPEDTVSLSLEYYRSELDKGAEAVKKSVKQEGEGEEVEEDGGGGEKRFLQCPAAVTMRHLQKFVRMKYALTVNHRVDIIYKSEVLPDNFSLMDVAYSFKWKRLKPLRFFYRIFTPMKVQPIKIINTTLSTGCKQLQVVKNEKTPPLLAPLPPLPPPLVPSSTPPPPKPDPTTKLPQNSTTTKTPNSDKNNKPTRLVPPVVPLPAITRPDDDKEKERLLANLHLKKNKGETAKSTQCSTIPDCVFDYEEPDKEEIKRFAEIRDREWAMQKRQEENHRHTDDEYHRFNRKRKKNKHSKNSGDSSLHKKRKLHAEITNKDEEELKLKVKLTTQPNGHKHKHHKSSSTSTTTAPPPLVQQELIKKEKLLQMRQIRHKQVISSTSSTPETLKSSNNSETVKKVTIVEPVVAAVPVKSEVTKTAAAVLPAQVQSRVSFPPQSILKNNSGGGVTQLSDNNSKKRVVPGTSSPLERKIANLQQRCTIEATSTVSTAVSSVKKAANSAGVFQQYPPGFTVSKIENGTTSAKRKSEDETNGHQAEKRPSLEITLINPNSESSTPAVPSSTGTVKPKRPPPATIPLERIKRSYAFNNKSGISIIAKNPVLQVPEQTTCDNIGALDLSSKKELANNKAANNNNNNNGFSSGTGGVSTASSNGIAKENSISAAKNILSNLQMLSKVATEHQSMSSGTTTSTASTASVKPRPQIPNLQTLKIPSLAAAVRAPRNLDNLPKLTEINNKTFRMQNPQIRNLRPTSSQNQSIRNIPNPSLLVRQQNQNRLNSLMGSGGGAVAAAAGAKSVAGAASVAVTSSVATVTAAGGCEAAAKVAAPENKKN